MVEKGEEPSICHLYRLHLNQAWPGAPEKIVTGKQSIGSSYYGYQQGDLTTVVLFDCQK